jgi:hypothetical protein
MDYTLPKDINYQKQLYSNLGIGNEASLNNSLSQNRLETDINAYLGNNPSVKSMLSSGVTIPKPVAPQGISSVNPTLPTTGSSIDTSIGAINNLQNPEAKYDVLGSSINKYLSGQNTVRDAMLQGIQKLNNIQLPTAQPSYMETYSNLANTYNVTGDATRLNELSRAITGTETDIRGEVAQAGGVANASQLASLTSERAKPLIREYDILKDALTVKNDMISKLMAYGQLDRQQAEKEVEMKTNLNEKIIDSYSKIGSADQATINSLMAYDNNQKTQAQKKLEMLLNSGGLSTLPDASLARLATDTGIDVNTIRSASRNIDIANNLKNQLTQAQITAQYASASKDRASMTPTAGQNNEGIELINNIGNVLANPNLNATSGIGGAFSIVNPSASALNAQVDQIKNQLVVDNRGKLKGQGAITEGETKMLEKSATILNTPFLSYDAKVAELQKIKGTVSLMNKIPTVVNVTDRSGVSKPMELTDTSQLETVVKNGGNYDFNVK